MGARLDHAQPLRGLRLGRRARLGRRRAATVGGPRPARRAARWPPERGRRSGLWIGSPEVRAGAGTPGAGRATRATRAVLPPRRSCSRPAASSRPASRPGGSGRRARPEAVRSGSRRATHGLAPMPCTRGRSARKSAPVQRGGESRARVGWLERRTGLHRDRCRRSAVCSDGGPARVRRRLVPARPRVRSASEIGELHRALRKR